MYAIFKRGSRQFKVSEGDQLELDRVAGAVGDKVTFDNVLMIGGAQAKFGSPFVAGASVEAAIEEHKRAPKITVFKYKRRKNYKVTQGHRQPVSLVKITKIKG